jgi:hypothetical protein
VKILLSSLCPTSPNHHLQHMVFLFNVSNYLQWC